MMDRPAGVGRVTPVNAHLDPLAIRRQLGRRDYRVPVQLDADGWGFAHQRGDGSVIVSVGEIEGAMWRHASMARKDRVPSYEDLCLLHRAAFGDGYAYQVFAPPSAHINIHSYALHLWGSPDGSRALPNFGAFGTI